MWLYMYDCWPPQEIDHVNGDRADNRLCNLRLTDRFGNTQNIRKPRKDNVTGFLGVSPCSNGFQAQISANKKEYHLGYFKTPEEASAAYQAAKRKLHSTCTI